MPLIGRRIAALAALALVTAGVLSGCVGQDPKPAPTPKPSATLLYPSEKEALAAAKVAYARYVDVSNQVAQGGWVDLTPLETVATGDALKADTRSGLNSKAAGLRAEGNAVGSIIRVQRTSQQSLTAYACVDVSQTRVYDQTGADKTSPTRAPIVAFETTFSRRDGQLLVERNDRWSGKSFCS